MELEDEQRNKWSEMLDSKYMSSEESADENILKVKPLPWLSIAHLLAIIYNTHILYKMTIQHTYNRYTYIATYNR